MENLGFGRGHGRNFDHLTMVMPRFWPWSWSKIFDHMTMTPGRRPNGQKIMVALPPPNLCFVSLHFLPNFLPLTVLCRPASLKLSSIKM